MIANEAQMHTQLMKWNQTNTMYYLVNKNTEIRKYFYIHWQGSETENSEKERSPPDANNLKFPPKFADK